VVKGFGDRTKYDTEVIIAIEDTRQPKAAELLKQGAWMRWDESAILHMDRVTDKSPGSDIVLAKISL
jgi:hypothetical protein